MDLGNISIYVVLIIITHDIIFSILFKQIKVPKKIYKKDGYKENNQNFIMLILSIVTWINEIIIIPMFTYLYININVNNFIDKNSNFIIILLMIWIGYYIFHLIYSLKMENMYIMILHHFVTIMICLICIVKKDYYIFIIQLAFIGKLFGPFLNFSRIFKDYEFPKFLIFLTEYTFYTTFIFFRIKFLYIWKESFRKTPLYFSINIFMICILISIFKFSDISVYLI